MKTRICSLAAEGSASHWSAGPPAAEMSAKLMVGRLARLAEPEIGPWRFHGKQMPFDCTQ
jgi:hypothetical protein